MPSGTKGSWRQTCGWLALAVASLWAAKFLLISAVAGSGDRLSAGTEFPAWASTVVGFVIPTAASLLGAAACSGLAALLVAGQRWYVGMPAGILAAVLGTAVISGLTNTAGQALASSATSPVVRDEGPILVTALLFILLAGVLLRPIGRWIGGVLVIGGATWVALVGADAWGRVPDPAWRTATYQAGLDLLVAAGVLLLAEALRQRDYRSAAAGLLVVALLWIGGGMVPILEGAMGLVLVGGLALLAGVARIRSHPDLEMRMR